MKNRNTALITGASQGIGREIATILASKGYNLVLVARNKRALELLVTELKEQFAIDILILAQDLTQNGIVENIVEILKEKQIIIGILVNNAGVVVVDEFATSEANLMLNMISLNINALTLLTRLLLPQMIERRNGKILNISSIAAYQAMPYMAVYAASKSYVLSFSHAISEELRGTGVDVTVVCPGVTNTLLFEKYANNISTIFSPTMHARDVALLSIDAMFKKKKVAIIGIRNKIAIALLIISMKILGLRLFKFLFIKSLDKNDSK